MEKSCEQWEYMQVGLKTWQDFKDHFSQVYRCYQICKRSTAASHGYVAAENHTQEIYAKVNTADALKALTFSAMEDKEAMAKLTSINLTLSQSLMKAQYTIMVISKQLQAFHTKTNTITRTKKRLVINNNTKENKLKCY